MQAYVVWEAQVQQVMLGGVIGDLQAICTSATTRAYLLLKGTGCRKILYAGLMVGCSPIRWQILRCSE